MDNKDSSATTGELVKIVPAIVPALKSDEKHSEKSNEIVNYDSEKTAGDVTDRNAPVKYPFAVIFIFCNEFCERFSFYGMQAILSIYLRDKLLYDADTATIIYHVFTMFVYFFPVFGAMIADSWLGKFKTIFYLSIVYALGNIVLASGSLPKFDVVASRDMTIIGLLLVAIGTGGIKPCVSSFGGDQFVLPQQERQLVQFFSVFYFAINVGSLISTFVTPILREDVHCFGDNDCYSLAFGVPGALMIISLLIFLAGKMLYTVKEPAGNMVLLVSKCICHAIARRSALKKTDKRDHWLDYADDEYDAKFIDGIKITLRVLVLYIPLPVFWALFDQQGSRWTFQATHMNGDIGDWTIKPEQLQVLNPVLILAYIPLFDYVLYPLFTKCHILTKPLTKLTVGGLLAALAFVVSGLVELDLEKTYSVIPKGDEAHLRIYNGFNCELTVDSDIPDQNDFIIKSLSYFEDKDITIQTNTTYLVNFKQDCVADFEDVIDVPRSTEISYFFMSKVAGTAQLIGFEDNAQKAENGDPQVRVLINSLTFYKFALIDKSGKTQFQSNSSFQEQKGVIPSKYNIELDGSPLDGEVDLKMGGSYTIIIDVTDPANIHHNILIITEPNSVHMLWLVPQYMIMTLGEVMFSVTGLEFSYSQAPVSMKSVLAAAWLLTTAFGNLIVVIIAEAKMSDSQAVEFFFFAALMVVTMIIFAFLAKRYKYVEREEDMDAITPVSLPLEGVDNTNFMGDHLE